jgi:hypothetical protein
VNENLPFIVWLCAFFATAAMYVRAAVLVVRSDPRYSDHVVWAPFPLLVGRSKMDPELLDRFYRAVMPWFGVFLLLILILAGVKYWPYAMMSLGWA